MLRGRRRSLLRIPTWRQPLTADGAEVRVWLDGGAAVRASAISCCSLAMRYALIGAIAEWEESADAANADWAAMTASTDRISAQALCRRLMRVFT